MPLAAIVLAAGRSRRFGQENKLLASLNGVAVIARTVAAVRGCPFDDVIVVTGPDHDDVARVLAGYPVRLVQCEAAHEGIGHSIAAGVGALGPDTHGVAIVPGDMPLLRSRTIQMLMDVFQAHHGQRIVHLADHAGEQRNPVLWPRTSFTALAALEGDRGAKALICNAIRVVSESDVELVDIDDAESLMFAQEALNASYR